MLSPSDILAHAVTASDFCTRYNIEPKSVSISNYDVLSHRVSVVLDIAHMRVAFKGHTAKVTRAYVTRYDLFIDGVNVTADDYADCAITDAVTL